MKTMLALLMLFCFSGCNPINSEPEEYIDLSSASPPASSVVVESSPTTTEVAPLEVAQVAPVDERTEVRVYTTENCPPCLRLKHEIAGLSNEESAELPVRFRHVAEVPEWVTGFPTLHWETPDGWVSTEGWNGLDKFLKVFEGKKDNNRDVPLRIGPDGTHYYNGYSVTPPQVTNEGAMSLEDFLQFQEELRNEVRKERGMGPQPVVRVYIPILPAPSPSPVDDNLPRRYESCRTLCDWYESHTFDEKDALPVHFSFISTETDGLDDGGPKAPDWVTGFPAFHWEAGGKWWSHQGWDGFDKFMSVWEQSQPLSSKKKDGITSQSEQSTEINSSTSSSESEPRSGDTVAKMPSSPWATGSSSSFRRTRR